MSVRRQKFLLATLILVTPVGMVLALMAYVPESELRRSSDLIVSGVVSGFQYHKVQESDSGNGATFPASVYTDATIRVRRWYKGHSGPEIHVRAEGGQRDDGTFEWVEDQPSYVPGESATFSLHHTSVPGIFQEEYGGYTRRSGDLRESGYVNNPHAHSSSVNISWNWAVQPRFDGAEPFYDGLAAVNWGGQRDDWSGRIEGGLWGYVDRAGNFVVNPQYVEVRPFSGGFAGVRVGSKWGFVNRLGELVIPPRFPYTGDFSEGVAVVQAIGTDSGKYGCIDTTGEFVIPPHFACNFHFSGGLAPVCLGETQNARTRSDSSRWGYIDRAGMFVIAPQFVQAEPFSEGLARIQIGRPRTGKWGYIDQLGRHVVAPQFFRSLDFHEGLAAVYVGGHVTDTWGRVEGGKWGYIDRAGQMAITPRFDWYEYLERPEAEFHNGYAEMNRSAGQYIDRSGNVFDAAPAYDAWDYSEGLAKEFISGKYGFIDSTQSIVVDGGFDDVGPYSEGLAAVKLNGKWGYIAIRAHPAPASPGGGSEPVPPRELPEPMRFPPEFRRPDYYGYSWVPPSRFFVRSVSVSPDGAILAAGYADGNVLLWDVATHKLIRRLMAGQDWAVVAFWQDGKTLATGFLNGPVILWDAPTWQPRETVWVHGLVFDMACSSGGQILAVSNGNGVHLWNRKTRRTEECCTGPGEQGACSYSVAISPDCGIIAMADLVREALELRDLRTYGVLTSFPNEWPTALAFSPDGRFLASGSQWGAVKLWKIGGDHPEPAAVLGTHNDDVTGVSFSPDGSLLASISGSSTLKVWDVKSLKCIMERKAEKADYVCGCRPCVTFHPDGKRIFFSFEEDIIRTLDLGDLATGTALNGTPHPVGGRIWLGADLSRCGLVYCVVYDPSSSQIMYLATENRGVMKSTDGGARWFEVNTGLTDRCVYWLVMSRGNPQVLYAGTQGKGVFKTTDGGASWVAVNTGLPQLSPGIYPAVWCLAIAPSDDSLIYAGTGGGLFRSPDGARNWYLVPGLPVGAVRSFGFGPGDANRMYTGYDWGGFYYSPDGSMNWRLLIDSLGFRKRVLGYRGLTHFVLDPTNPDIIYYIFGPGGIYRSTNGGVSWDFFNSGFPTNVAGGGLFYLVWIALDPNNPLILYGAGNDGRVYISRDGGKSWSDCSYGLGNPVPGSISTIGFDPRGRPWIGGRSRLIEQGQITERKTLSAMVYFGFDSTDIKPIAYPVLDSIVTTLKADPTLRAVIEGHTDSIGTESYNQNLSQRRANSVVSYLASKGIASSRLTATGYGETMPIASNSTDEGRQKNRRVEILIVSRTK